MDLKTCLSLCALLGTAQAAPDSDLTPRIAGDTEFGLALHRQVRAGSGNLFFSPQSISLALAMTSAGAAGQTAAEMQQVMRWHGPSALTHQESAALAERWRLIQESGTVEFAVANSLWPQADAEFLPEFLALIKRFYHARITPVDFAGDPVGACRAINGWVEDKTRNKIRDLLSPGVVGPLTRLVLVNAIYFKGQWANPFPARNTRSDTFHSRPDRPVEAPFMNLHTRFGYAEDDPVQLLELPYAGGDLSMVILLPKTRNGLEALEDSLTEAVLSRWIKSLAQAEVQVALPKFTLTSEFRLDSALQTLGIREAFDRKRADFSGMNGRKDDLYIGAVVHKAFVDVSEEGTEAAAATGVVVVTRASAPPVVRTFRADHPFLFLIRDRATGSLLFLGRVTDPTR